MTGLSTGGVSTLEGPVILIGYEYRLQLQADTALFPEACVLAGQMRTRLAALDVIATLLSATGSLIRIDDYTLEIVVAADVTAALIPGSVVVDFVRTDLTPERPLGFSLEIPVQQSVTRGL